MNTEQFFKEYVDLVVPKLETIEQAIYLYVVRHTIFENKENILVSISSAAKSNAFGLSGRGGTMGISQTRDKVYTLQEKGFIEVVDSTSKGLRLKAVLPSENPAVRAEVDIKEQSVPLEELDFYAVPELRQALRDREGNKCFYSFKKITNENFTIDHVISRPKGKNTYNNLVATTKAMNNKKANMAAQDFLRSLYRDGLLSESEFQERTIYLEQLQAWELKPNVNG
ncbi:HNH endonuclease domain-containing protein [uncultured Shewanella sp.]|uniref:HNH endonuclease n=1 Tax=uncultured Shewanella sp. TaxID=173975 RepID=UPI00261D485E|nr:HNH endonuclease domain-containing protein [uncultured Shewanella sp.]